LQNIWFFNISKPYAEELCKIIFELLQKDRSNVSDHTDPIQCFQTSECAKIRHAEPAEQSPILSRDVVEQYDEMTPAYFSLFLQTEYEIEYFSFHTHSIVYMFYHAHTGRFESAHEFPEFDRNSEPERRVFHRRRVYYKNLSEYQQVLSSTAHEPMNFQGTIWSQRFGTCVVEDRKTMIEETVSVHHNLWHAVALSSAFHARYPLQSLAYPTARAGLREILCHIRHPVQFVHDTVPLFFE